MDVIRQGPYTPFETKASTIFSLCLSVELSMLPQLQKCRANLQLTVRIFSQSLSVLSFQSVDLDMNERVDVCAIFYTGATVVCIPL